MEKLRIIRSLSLIILALCFYGCPEENPSKPSKVIVDIEETIVEQKSENIDVSGGQVVLSDGTAAIIPPGGASGSTKVIISKIKNDNYFSGTNRASIDIGSDIPLSNLTLKIKVPAGLQSEDIGLFRYNPADVGSVLTGDIPDFDYDSQKGFITATVNVAGNATKKEKAQGSLLFPRWVAEWDEHVEGESSTMLIQMPFYEQPGSSCWATAATMLAKAYTPYKNRRNEPEVYMFLKYLQLGRDDGIWPHQFLKTLINAIHLYSGGMGLESSGYFRLSSLKEKLLTELDKGHPILVSLPYPGVGAHVVMIVGYTKKTSGSNKVTYDLVIHNPQGTGSETMYTVHDFDYVFKEKSMTQAVQVIWATDKPHPDRALLTMGLPLAVVGDIKFKVPFKTSAYNIDFKEDISSKTGYRWAWSDKSMDAIPDTASDMILNLPLWNSSQSGSKTAKIELKVWRSNKIVYEFSESITVAASPNASWFNKTIPLSEIRGKADSSEYYFEFAVFDDFVYVDGFDFYVNIDATHPLNGRWNWNTLPLNDDCKFVDKEEFEVTLRVGKTSISFINEDDEDLVFEFTFDKDDFTMHWEESSEEYLTITGYMQGPDKFSADVFVVSTKSEEDEEGELYEVPCTSTAKIIGTRIK